MKVIKIGAMLLGAAIVFLASCAKEVKPYDDLREVLTQMHDLYLSNALKIGKATTPKDAAGILIDFANAFKQKSAELKLMRAKYPQLSNTPEPPAELKDVVDSVQEAATNFFTSMEVIRQWGDDPLILEALSKMNEDQAGPQANP